jgi:acetyltransferase
VIGAGERPGSLGGAVVRNLLESGFSGPVVPVNPKWATVHGMPAVPRVAAAGEIDLAVICTPAATVPGLVRECGEAGVEGVLVLSAGFREIGAAGAALEASLRTELDRYPGTRMIGPNCLGLIVPSIGLNATFARTTAKPGGIALLSQSGALCASMLAWAQDQGTGFSHFVSVGNMVDVGFGDLLDSMADDPETTAVVLYIEAVRDADRFLAAAGRCTARKPVIAFKAGRHPAAAKAAASHTGAMAGEDAVYEAAFDEVGIVRVKQLDELLGIAQLLGAGRHPAPPGSRLAIVTNAGGPGVIAADALLDGHGELAQLSDLTIAALNSGLPAHWSHGNPVDVIGDAGPDRLETALGHVLQDDGVDAALVIVTPQATIDTTSAAWAVSACASRQTKPVLSAWMVGAGDSEGLAALRYGGVPTYATPEQAVRAFLYLAEDARRRARRVEPAYDRAASGPDPRGGPRAADLLAGLTGTLGECESKEVLAACGISVLPTVVAGTADAAVRAARAAGYPVVLKVVSPGFTHKTDIGGVALDVRDDLEAAAAFERIGKSLRSKCPGAAFAGVTVQRMLDGAGGIELIVGAKRDPTFGPVVMVGAGGTTAEVFGDRAIGLAPITTEGARRLLERLRIAPLLGAFRGRGALDIEAAAAAIVGMSRLIVECPKVAEADANPVLVTPEGATILDARIIISASPSDA